MSLIDDMTTYDRSSAVLLDSTDGIQPDPPMPMPIFRRTLELLGQVAEVQGRTRVTTAEVFGPWNAHHHTRAIPAHD